jgi:hypothetical protein
MTFLVLYREMIHAIFRDLQGINNYKQDKTELHYGLWT